MSVLVAAVIAVFPAGLMAYLQITGRCSRLVRERMRPHAERLIIEKRWIERAARSPAQFDCEWRSELLSLYRTHVPARARLAFGLGDFERALNAEFACLTNREIASWTFADRVSDSPQSFQMIIARSLEHFGWTLTIEPHPIASKSAPGSRLLVASDRRQFVILCHHSRQEVQCRSVIEIAQAARKLGVEAGCIITNGRFNGSTRALAEQFRVTLLHCSQLDLLPEAARATRTSGPAWQDEERLAA